ncbi:MAG: hypothetical protein JWN40_4842 [Phycisphaerales bacterium]|nr:hypothetical protein [Phycisphaerales bacterium]
MRGRSKAFTLVEMLVVIGILALLIAILLPALNRARESANTVNCLSNMKQFTAAAMNYAADNKGYIIPCGTPQAGWWCNIMVDNKYLAVPGQTGNAPKTSGVFYCPSGNQDAFPPDLTNNGTVPSSRVDERSAMGTQQTSPRTGVRIDLWYGMNASEGSATKTGAPCRRIQADTDRLTTLGMIKKSSQTVMFYDGIIYHALEVNANRISARHGRKTQTNLAFFDGHAETFFTNSLPGGMGTASTAETTSVFSAANLKAKYPHPLWRLEQQYQ